MEEKKYVSTLKPHLKYYPPEPHREFDTSQTIYSLVRDANQLTIDYDAIGYFGHSYTYKELFRDVERLAQAFLQMGIRENDVVLIGMPTTPEVAKVLLALNKIGAVSKWIDIQINEETLEKYINENGSKHIVLFDKLLPQLEKIIDNTNVQNAIISRPSDSLSFPEKIGYMLQSKKEGTYYPIPNDRRYVDLPTLIKQGKSNDILMPAKYDKDKTTLIIQSSGTTGMAKSIAHTDFTVNEAIQKLGYSDLPLDAGKRLLVTVPPWVGYGLVNSYLTSLAHGMEAVLCPKVDRTTVFDNVGKFNTAFAAPLHYRCLVDNIDKCKDLSEIEALITGGDKITAEELTQMMEILRQKGFDGQIINGYGNNEGLGGETVNPMGHNRLGSVGIPMYGNIVAAFDEKMQELPINEQGEIAVKTSTMFKEYIDNPIETSRVKKRHNDGSLWIHTGDLGHIDDDGFVYIEGRKNRVIISRSFKVFPGTIESLIKKHPAVKACITVGVNDPQFMGVPMAHIVLHEEYLDKTEEVIEELNNICLANLKDYEVPMYYNILEEIPYTQNNKEDFRFLEKLGNELVEGQKVRKRY